MRISDWSSDVCSSDLTAHLEPATGALREFAEVVGLVNHVIEFEERQRLLAIEPQLDRIEAQHPVDRQMLADRARSEEHTSELQSLMAPLVCRLLLAQIKK